MAIGNVSLGSKGTLSDQTVPTTAFSFAGTIAGTGAADTSGVITSKGYPGVRFKVVMATYRGTFKIQASFDNTTFFDVFPFNVDAATATTTFYWQCFEGYDYFRIIGDPNGANAGTVTVTGELVGRVENPGQAYTGFCGPHSGVYQFLGTTSITADLPKTYFFTKGPGCKVMVNLTVKGGGVLKFQIYGVDPVNQGFHGAGIAAQYLQSAVVNETGQHVYTVSLSVTAASNVSASAGGHFWAIDSSAYDSGTYTFTAQVESLDC